MYRIVYDDYGINYAAWTVSIEFLKLHVIMTTWLCPKWGSYSVPMLKIKFLTGLQAVAGKAY